MNTIARELADSFDLEKLTPEFYADPYPTYRALREHAPVKRMANGSYFLTRYDDLLTAYSYAIDFHRWDELDEIFTPDATLDFTGTGGESGDLATMKQWLAQALGNFAAHQHLMGNTRVQFDGDRATAQTMCHNPMIVEVDGAQRVLFVGLWYLDELVRTDAGWRISARRQQKSYLHAVS